MPTEKQTLAYINKRIEQYKKSAALYRKQATERPSVSAKFKARADGYESNATVLGHIKFYIENGTEHPDLLTLPTAEKKEVEISE